MELLETEECLENPAPATPVKVLPAKLRTRSGTLHTIDVLDVSVAGCLIERRAICIADEDRVLIRFADLSFIAARVAWVEDRKAGLLFEAGLYEPVLQHLTRAAAWRH